MRKWLGVAVTRLSSAANRHTKFRIVQHSSEQGQGGVSAHRFAGAGRKGVLGNNAAAAAAGANFDDIPKGPADELG